MNDDEVQQAVDLLKKLRPGFLPYPIFEQVARLVTLPIIEFVPLRFHEGSVEVLLIERPVDDAFWPGKLHTPGTVIRATDDNQANGRNWPAFDRLLQDELKGTPVGQPHYVGSRFGHSKRGAEQAQLYWIEVTGQPIVGEFYPIDQLPDSLIEGQIGFIQESARHFQDYLFKR